MSMPKSDIGIARNIKTIEWLKAELVSGVATFFGVWSETRKI